MYQWTHNQDTFCRVQHLLNYVMCVFKKHLLSLKDNEKVCRELQWDIMLWTGTKCKQYLHCSSVILAWNVNQTLTSKGESVSTETDIAVQVYEPTVLPNLAFLLQVLISRTHSLSSVHHTFARCLRTSYLRTLSSHCIKLLNSQMFQTAVAVSS